MTVTIRPNGPDRHEARPATEAAPGTLRVGLVLGGGGIVGMGYHAAALAALENDLGWDPRSAEVIVGTSVGSLVGAMLRRGMTGMDLAALTVGVPAPEAPEAMAAAMRDRTTLPAPTLRSMLRLRPPAASIISSWLRQPWRIDPLLACSSLLAEGRISMEDHLGDHLRVLDGTWPDASLWICAVRRRDLHRVVLGRDQEAPLSAAVAASCSIPGYFTPTSLAADEFIDGGVRSPTNADVLRRSGVDLAVIISPMSGQHLPRWHPAATLQRHARSRVDRERRVLLEHGIPSLLIEPGPATSAIMGHDVLRDDHLGEIVTAALLDTGEQLRSTAARAEVRQLSLRAHHRRRPVVT